FDWRSERAPEGEVGAVHPRILEVPLGEREGDVAFVLTVWRDPGGAAVLHARMRRLIETVLLAELSRPPGELIEEVRRPVALRVVFFEPIDGLEDALRAFGLREADVSKWNETLRQLRAEASRAGVHADAPVSAWETPFLRQAGVDELELDLRARLADTAFGVRPGMFFAAFNQVREELGEAPLSARVESLGAIEGAVVPRDAGAIRWIPPVLFQTLCDAVAVAASEDLGRDVQWASSEPEEDGFAPPPMFRVKEHKGWAHVTVARDLLRWLVMPRQEGEEVPPLPAWTHDRLGRGSGRHQ
ncbi:MAG: hypothetical protein AAF645_29785, partial [Myxococcota bacterium]